MSKATVALAMIVRNEEANLPACLDSIDGLFDELVIVDTGSTDDTVKIARGYGARVPTFRWCDDFSAARNFGLGRVKSDYVFRLDADDRLFSGHRKRLSRLFQQLDRNRPAAFFCRVHAAEPDGSTGLLDEHRLWPNRPALRFHGRIHERIRLAEDAPGVPVYQSNVRIDHHGYADPALHRLKLERNLRVLEMECAAGVVDPIVVFDMGRTFAGLGRLDEALDCLRGYLTQQDPRLILASKVAHRRIVEILVVQEKHQEAMEAASEGLKAHPDDALLVAWVGNLLAYYGENDLAREGLQKALELYDPGKPDAGIPAGFRTRVVEALKRLEIASVVA